MIDDPSAPPQSRLGNILLSLTVSLTLLGGLEGLSRYLEPSRPTRAATTEWAPEGNDHFYTLKRDSVGWPPWQEVNADGVRDRAHPRDKPEGMERVVFLGDSVTAGFGIKAEEAYPRLLQDKLDQAGRRIEVFDVAVWGWSTRQERIAYHRIARAYQPDRVVLAVCLNDIPELEWQTRPPPRLLSWLHLHSALVRRVVNASYREMRGVEELFHGQASLEPFFQEVRALRDEVRADGAEFSLMVFPFRFQLGPSAPAPSVQRSIVEFCAREKIAALDLLPRFAARGESVFFDENHLTRIGSELTATAILEAGLLPPADNFTQALAAWLRAEGAPAAAALAWVDSRSMPAGAIPGLLRALTRGDERVRAQAAWALGQTGYGSEGVSGLAIALQDPEEPVRAAAASALASGGIPARAAIPGLLLALDDPRQVVRWQAATALWKLEVASAGRVPELKAALGSRDPYVRNFAAWTLGQLGGAAADAIPALIRLAEDEAGNSRAGAGRALRELGPATRSALPELRQGLASTDPESRLKAARVLEKLGPVASDLVPELTRVLADPDQRVRAQAAIALGNLGLAARPALDPLIARLADPSPWVRSEVARAVGKIDAGSARSVEALIPLLADPEAEVRLQAVRALGRMKAAAAPARAALEKNAGDASERVRTEVAAALEKIRG